MAPHLFDQFDDLTVLAGDPGRPHGFTLTGIVHNEMHFLPIFLPHYRKLGVDRFVFIDDQSDDDTTAFLAAQPDVIVLGSARRFSDKLTAQEAGDPALQNMRMMLVWRNLLLRKFGCDGWSVHLDADEFIDLPPGMTLPDLARSLDGSPYRSVWSVMLDMYPASVADLLDMKDDPTVDFQRDWYFDGRRHLRLRRNKGPRTVYGGVRARLMLNHNLNPKAHWFDRHLGPRLGLAPRRYNAIRKPVLLRWGDDAIFHSPHRVNLAASPKILLPLRHYKFNGAIAQRIAWAIKTGGYSGGSAEYHALEKLLADMFAQDLPFKDDRSRAYRGFDDFVVTGNASGFD